MTVAFDGAPAERVRAIIMAIQLGPTYGSGYRICPDADPCDGILDVCYACGPVPRAVALPMFLSAKDGHHTKLPPVRMRRCRHAELTFEEPNYPIQSRRRAHRRLAHRGGHPSRRSRGLAPNPLAPPKLR